MIINLLDIICQVATLLKCNELVDRVKQELDVTKDESEVQFIPHSNF